MLERHRDTRYCMVMPNWWKNAPWADRERPGVQMFWVSALGMAVVVIAGLLGLL